MRAQQTAGVANAPVDAGAARTVQQPCIDLRQMIVHREPHGFARIGVRRGFAQTQLDLIAGRIGLHFQKVHAARLQQYG